MVQWHFWHFIGTLEDWPGKDVHRPKSCPLLQAPQGASQHAERSVTVLSNGLVTFSASNRLIMFSTIHYSFAFLSLASCSPIRSFWTWEKEQFVFSERVAQSETFTKAGMVEYWWKHHYKPKKKKKILWSESFFPSKMFFFSLSKQFLAIEKARKMGVSHTFSQFFLILHFLFQKDYSTWCQLQGQVIIFTDKHCPTILL